MPAVTAVMVMIFPADPLATNAVKVCVVEEVNRTAFGAPRVKVLYVFDPVKVTDPVPPPVTDTLLYVRPPPANVLVVELVSDTVIVEVPGVSVSPVVAANPHVVPVPETVTADEPSVNDRVLVPEVLMILADNVWL